MTASIRLTCALALALLLLAPAEARAAAADCQATSACRTLLEKGITEFKRNHYEIAVGFFKEAYSKVADPRLLVFIGRARFKQKRPDEALDNYQRALPDVTDALDRTKLEQYISDARAALGPAAAQQPSATASVATTPKAPATPERVPEKSPQPATEKSASEAPIAPPIAQATTDPAQAPAKVEEPAPQPLALVTPAKSPPSRGERKVKPWAWALIGVAAAGAVGAAVGLGVYYGTSVPVPDGKTTYP